MNFESIASNTDNFLKQTNDIVLFGASSGGYSCYCWLNTIGQWQRVKYYVDNDASKHNTIYNDIKVCSPSTLKEDANATILIASDYYNDILSQLIEMDLTNCILYFDSRFPYISGLSINNDFSIEDVSKYYNISDIETKESIDYCFLLRDIFGGGAVIDLRLQNKNAPLGYWEQSDTCLSFFSALTIVDAGAYVGDSFQKFTQQYETLIQGYHAFEPELANYKKLVSTMSKLGKEKQDTKAYNAGVSNKSDLINVAHSYSEMMFNLSTGGGV